MKTNQRSFTLIELLVAIAIIGLLTSIVLVSVGGMRNRARIARDLDFSHTLQNTIGAYAVGVWEFETIEPGDKVIDGSGHGNHGTVHDATLVEGVKINGGTGNALSFNGSNDCIEIPDSDSLDGMDAITIELWIKPHEKDKLYFIHKKDSYEYKYTENHGDYELEFKVHNKDIGGFKVEAKDKVDIGFGKWHHLVATYDGSAKVKIFLDAKELSLDTEKVEEGGPVGNEDSILYLGCKDGNKEHYDGFMDEVKIYGKTLTSGKIKKHYTEGVIKRGSLVKE